MGILDDYLDPDTHLWPSEPPDGYDEAWKVLNNLYGQPVDNRNEEKIKRCVYKYTDCGAYICFDDSGITLGSIVEGSDIGCQNYRLPWKMVTEDAVTKRLDAIEKEAEAVWKWANDVGNDDMTDAEHGVDFPDVAWDFRHLL